MRFFCVGLVAIITGVLGEFMLQSYKPMSTVLFVPLLIGIVLAERLTREKT